MYPPGSLLIIDLDRTGVFPARPLALALGLEGEEVVGGFDAAIALIEQGRPVPRHLLIDIGLHGDDIFPALEHLMRLCEGAARVIVIGNVNDLHFYRALKQLGVWEYFTHPADVTEIANAFNQPGLLQRAPSSEELAQQHQQGKVISFISAASGDGASTTALNVAYALATGHRVPTVIVDMDYQFGMVARHLDLSAQFGIRELFEYPERGVDATLLSKMLLPYGDSQLSVIAAPNALRLLPTIRPETVHELIAVLRRQFTFVVLDVPHVWMPWTAEALLQADRVVAVGQLWLRSLTHLSRMMSAWNEIGVNKDNILLAVNRVGAKYREAITPQDFERVVLKNINFYLSNDIKTVVAADNQGKTVVEISNSQLERQFRDIARVLFSLRSGFAPAEPAVPWQQEEFPRKKGLRGLLGG